jgi:Cytochrome bd terminal oxidase subunit II
MPTVWFILVAFMITAYVVMDGFDIGAGVLHVLVARTDEERRAVLGVIGPVWDGNEVWLIAAGGTLFLAFPLLYASSFSGFYMPPMGWWREIQTIYNPQDVSAHSFRPAEIFVGVGNFEPFWFIAT